MGRGFAEPGHVVQLDPVGRKQTELAAEFGDTWAHADPDLRPEFNDDEEGWS